ncbi:sensor histidine kinase [Anabaena subtropica]|uniref:GAF domain-containing protein n=1 Tax=Anabaena subtropica FACHB-260 TaxID=2692884 RepID=A0ABR8CU99_9NOST|nr:GAF domain-containing protein [Anabaena subtropica]MBD2345933.1 GAF domain-containing protein [Anabaena subtropica FACHB-260]
MGQPHKSIAAEQPILALGRVLQSLREGDDVDVLIETTIHYIHQEFNYKLIWIAAYDRLKHSLFGKGGITPGGDVNFLRKRLVLQPGDLLEQVVIQQSPLGVADIRNEKRAGEWREVGTKFNIQGTIILPMRHKDRCMGVLLLGSERWGYLLPEDAKARLMMVLGELGAILYQHEIHLQQKQIKRPDEPLLHLLENVRNLNNLEERLKAVVEATQDFVSPSRTNVYWFERQGRYFWCRMGNQLVNLHRDANKEKLAAGMTVQELSELYYALSVNQIVWIGDARSSLEGQFTAKLLQKLRVRSLLAAPIIWQKDLLGFLAVEGYEPRIWTEADKNFVQGAAGFISLVAPNDKIENTVKQIQEDSQLTSEVAQSIYTHQDLKETLHTCASRVLTRLNATRFLLLHYDQDQNNYQVIYQTQPHNRRPLISGFSLLSETDRQMLKSTKTTVEIENVEEDLRFFNWRSLLLENGVRSLLICNCAQGHKAEALLIVTHTNHRSWTNLEKEMLWIVSQQIGVVVRQWRLQTNNEQQQHILHSIQQCLRIEGTESPNSQTEQHHLECTALRQIASVLNCPLALLLSWSHGESTAEIIPGVIADSRFEVVLKSKLSIQYEALIQWALAENSYLNVSVDHLPPETRQWLHGSGIGQVLLMALRTGVDHQPTGVILLADHRERHWPQHSLNTGEILIDQLAWLRRQQQISQRLESTTQELRQLNWYKHRRLEEIQRTAIHLLGQIHDLGIPSNDLTQTRYQLLLRQLDHTTASMTSIVKLEQWQLHVSWETMPISSLLKRSLERIDNLVQQKKLWIGVHGLGQPTTEKEAANSPAFLKGVPTAANPSTMAISGDIGKFELVLHELLLAACHRSPNGSRIDIWCRRLDEQFLEVSITDNGTIETQLLTELQQKTHKDVLAFCHFDQSPNLNLLICQQMMQQLGGELDIYQLPDHRVVSRLVLPLADVNS